MKHESVTNRICALVVYLGLIIAVSGGVARAQALQELFTPHSPISKGSYKTWSLFLVTNPEWVLPQSNKKLEELYRAYQAFGKSIGPDHLAVWFWSEDPRRNQFYSAVDVMRAAAFCTTLKLPPGKGPYVIVTSQYPGPGDLSKYPEGFATDLGNFHVIELNQATSTEIVQMLTKLADQLLSRDLSALDPNSETYWRAWQKSFEAIRSSLVGFSKKIHFKIKTAFFETEI